MNYFNIDNEAKPKNKMQLNVAMGQREHEPTQGGRRNQRALRAELKLGAISILTSPNQVVVPLGSEAPRNSRSREAKLVQSGDALARRRERETGRGQVVRRGEAARQGRGGGEEERDEGRGAKGWSHVTRHVSMIRTGPLDRVRPGYLLQAPWIASHRFARAHLVFDSNRIFFFF
jgi:hypothetical protein